MCSVRHRPMPDGAERDGVGGLFRRVGIGADLEPGGLRAPVHELLEVLIGLAFFAGLSDFSTSTWTISEAAVGSWPA